MRTVFAQELRQLLLAALKENVVELSSEQMQEVSHRCVEHLCISFVQVIDHTLRMADMDQNGSVEFAEYQKMVSQVNVLTFVEYLLML